MEPASRAFAETTKNWRVDPPRFPVLSYLRGEFLRTPEEIKEELSIQYCRPNYWHKVLLRMMDEGMETYVEVGPGNVLSQMVRWVNRSARTITGEEILAQSPSAYPSPP
jgi:[acyl-carrier-protein] S-malonyltransferase